MTDYYRILTPDEQADLDAKITADLQATHRHCDDPACPEHGVNASLERIDRRERERLGWT